jgi:hypothetical protein
MSVQYVLVTAGLGFFATGGNAGHRIFAQLTEGFPAVSMLGQATGMIEDGGEMLVASVSAA